MKRTVRGQHHEQPALGALLAFVFSGSVEAVANEQLELCFHFRDGFLDGAALLHSEKSDFIKSCLFECMPKKAGRRAISKTN